MTDLVSAVIPTYNYGRFVTAAVESALGQTYRPIEVIVVDDGSTDDTRARLEPFAARIRYIYQKNQGLSAARNTGIRLASAKLIAFLDSDDEWHPRRLECQMHYLKCHPQFALLASDHCEGSIPIWEPIGDPGGISAAELTVKQILVRSRFGSCGVLARKECFDAAGLFDTGLQSAEDRDMWLRIAAKFPVAKLQAPLWWYRHHGDSMSTAAVRMEENEMKVVRRALALLEPVCGDPLLKRKVLSFTLRSAAYRYDLAGRRMRAAWRVLQSLALWPFPFHRDEAYARLERPKMLALFLFRLLFRSGARI